MIYLGIDPGIRGSITVLDDTKWIESHNFKIKDNGIIKNQIDVEHCLELFMHLGDRFTIDTVFIEKPFYAGITPKAVVASQYYTYATLTTLLQVEKFNIYEIAPKEWKKFFNLINKEKRESKVTAIKIDPNFPAKLRNDHAEATLIGIYGYKNIKRLKRI